MSIQFGRAALILSFVSSWMVFSQDAAAQDPPFNASLRSHWDEGGGYADIWADGDFVYIGRFRSAGVEIVNISNPDSIFSVGPYILPGAHSAASAQDVKVGDGLLFVALEGTTNAGIHIVDVRDPTNPTPLVDIDITGFNKIHNLFYDQGFLYFADSSSPRVGIVDLRALDPDNTPGTDITATKWILNNIGTSIVHDMTVQDGRLYVAAWGSGLWVYAVDQVATTAPVLLGTTGGNNTHACWPTDDGKFVVTAEERAGGGIKVYEITDNGATITLTFRDSAELTSTGQAYSVHNPVVVGNRVYCSWYQAGLQVFDIDPSSGMLSLVASFDTTSIANNGGFAGNWGVYPLLGSDRICLSDLSEGLFVVDVSRSVGISFPNGLPDAVTPGEPTDIDVSVIGLTEAILPNSQMLHYRFDGGSFQTAPLVPISANLFRATLPPAECGDTLFFFFSAEGEDSGPFSEPSDAPTSTFKSKVGAFEQVQLLDNFETDTGWIVSGDATSGQWERATPSGGGRGNPSADADGSGNAYVTENGGPGSDVDDGATVLTSPPFNVVDGQWISYAYWLNDALVIGTSDQPDTLTVEVATDAAGTNWQLVRTYRIFAPNWRTDRIEIGNEAPASTTLRLRFTATDLGLNTTIEAGVDAVRILEVQCGGVPDCTIPGDDDMDGVCNDADDCPDTAVNDPVDENGCSTADDDGDGVLNDQDACKTTPTCATTVDANGCEGDGDADGVADGCDICPATALNDPVDGEGCSTADDDGDGVLNDQDACKTTPPCATTVDANGCEVDGDGDGVADGCDNCPGTALNDPVDGDGCPTATDENEGDPGGLPFAFATCPGDVTIPATSAAGIAFHVAVPSVPAITNAIGKVTIAVNPALGTVFPVGTTAVTFTASDESGKGVTCAFNVTVIAPAPVGFVIPNLDCGCGNGTDGMIMMPLMWIGIRRVRRRRGMGKTRRRP